MNRSFRYNSNRRTIISTILTFVVFAVVALLLLYLYKGGFFSAWFVSLVLAIIALMVLSIPRRIAILGNTLEIQCISDITEIDIREIATIKKVDRKAMRWVFPLFGAVGFLGYYGKFVDIKEFDIITIYASEWDNFVEITDIYDNRTYVSCRKADDLIDTVMTLRHELAESGEDILEEQ